MNPTPLAVALCLAAIATAQRPAAPDSVRRLVDLLGLPVIEPGVTCRQFASTDPSGNGEDHGHFLRREGTRCVLAEMQGPGVITRLWSANAMGRLRIYLDGEDRPRIEAPFQDLFTGKLPPFVEPIAVHASGGWISYFPIPYARSCRVEVDQLENPAALYYQVQYATYPPDTPMRTFTPELPPDEQAALAEVVRRWRQPSAREPAAGEIERRSSVSLERGDTKTLFAHDGPGTILSLRLRPTGTGPGLLRGLLVTCTFDGVTTVQAPLGDLFACGFGATPFAGLAFGWDGAGGYLRLPMPFRESARIDVHSTSADAAQVDCTVQLRPDALDKRAGLLHAEFRAQDGVGDDLYEFARVTGPGKFVGIAQALQGVGDLWYLEGNEQLFVDGEAQPSILGTGTEDFYNGGWYWNSGTLALPLHGLGVKQEWTTNRTTPWRMQVPDAVPFHRGLVARIEHGSRNAVRDGYYSSVAFWYGPPRAVRAVTATELALPRLWVSRPKGAVGAAALAWQPQPELRRWEELTNTHRGLDRPLFQAFPVSYVEHDGAPVDARLAVLAGNEDERSWRATFEVPHADRYRLELRFCGVPPTVLLDGQVLTETDPDLARAPVYTAGGDVGGLTAGAHTLEFVRPAGATEFLALDCLRLVSASPFVRTWRIGPPVSARPDGTVEDPMPEEARFLAADFDPAAAGWKLVQAPGNGIDLNREVSAKSPMLAYLMAFVHSPQARTVRALLGSDDGVRVWLNGELRWSHELHRHLTADEDAFDLPLRQGWNRLLLKVKNDYGGYGLMLRLCDPDGTLRIAGAAR